MAAPGKMIEFGGETLRQAEWARRLGISQSWLSRRLTLLGPERALTEPIRRPETFVFDGRTWTLPQLVRERAVVSEALVRRRLRAGWPLAAALAEPAKPGRKRPLITIRGLGSKTIQEWAAERSIPLSTLRHRLDLGWSIERAVLTPARSRPKKT
jgi:hypothetical protein